jgi:uncharacterized protein (TIGR02996 family)
MRTFEWHRPGSHRFWTIEIRGNCITVTSGKVGRSGRSRTKDFATAEEAQGAAEKLIRAKRGKGYIETTPPVATPQAAAFERELTENTADPAVWSAYADYLAEQGSPRGDFMQVQIALESESRPTEERKQLQAREKELLAKHEGEWLGSLAPHLLDRVPNNPASDDYDPGGPAGPGSEHRWRRGVLAELKVGCITIRLAQALADAPAVRFLEKLHVVSTAYYIGMQDDTTPRRVPIPQVTRAWSPHPETAYRDYNEWFELLGAPLLRSVRVFQMGDRDGEPPEDGWQDNHTYAPGIDLLIAEMPRIEELHLLCKEYDRAALFALPNLTNLRVLRLYALGDPYWSTEPTLELDLLAANPALRNLTHLMVHPHFARRSVLPLGRVVPLFRSPHLKSLTHLQLRLSDMGDEGVREIVSSGILKRLRWLDLRHGCITDDGATRFAACADTRNLERLDLSRNAVSSVGLNALRKAGVKAVANNPLTAQELAQQRYLHEGDFE